MSRVRVRRRRAEARVRVESRTREWGYRPRPAGVPSAVRLPRRAARSEGPAFLWNGLLDDYNSSPSVNQYFLLRRLRWSLRSRRPLAGRSGDAGYAYAYGLRGMIGARPMCDRDDVAGPRLGQGRGPGHARRPHVPNHPRTPLIRKATRTRTDCSTYNVQRAGATEPNGARFTSRPVVEVVL